MMSLGWALGGFIWFSQPRSGCALNDNGGGSVVEQSAVFLMGQGQFGENFGVSREEIDDDRPLQYTLRCVGKVVEHGERNFNVRLIDWFKLQFEDFVRRDLLR